MERLNQLFPDRPCRTVKGNVAKARQIQALYDSLKRKPLELTHSQFAVPLLDHMFEQPIFRSSRFVELPDMPSRPMILNMLGRLKTAGILKVVQEARGPRAQVLALAALVNLCEGKEIV